MTARPANELLYDSEAALRLVDSAIEDIRDAGPRDPGVDADPASEARLRTLIANGSLGSPGLPQVVERGYSEIVSVLGSLRESRSALERAAAAGNQSTTQQLSYASAVLHEMESRLAGLAAIFDPTAR
jgi:hypothetical protein